MLAPRATLNVASAGSDPSEVTEVAVNPTGEPSALFSVITQTPDACLLNACFRASVLFGILSMVNLSSSDSRLT